MVDISLCPKRVLEILSMIFSFLCYLMCSFQSSLFQVYLIILYLFSGLTGTPADPAEHVPIIRKYIKQNTGVAITLSFSFCQKMVRMLPATMFVFNLFFMQISSAFVWQTHGAHWALAFLVKWFTHLHNIMFVCVCMCAYLHNRSCYAHCVYFFSLFIRASQRICLGAVFIIVVVAVAVFVSLVVARMLTRGAFIHLCRRVPCALYQHGTVHVACGGDGGVVWPRWL